MWRMEFDNLIDSSQFFFLFEEEQQLRAIENKRVKERKKILSSMLNLTMEHRPISSSQSFNFFLLSHQFRYLTANEK